VRTLAVWLVFVGLFISGPSPWGNPNRFRRHSETQPTGLVASVKGRAEEALVVGQPADAAALLQGMVLGDASRLSKSAQDDFRRASLTHVVAASGQNISLMLALALPVLGGLGLTLRRRLAVGAALVLLYVPLAGGEAPIRRAAVMALVLVAARLRGSPADGWHALGVAGVLTLLADRTAAASLGWQLSFAAVAGMLSLGRRLITALERKGVPAPVAEAAAMTLAATLATTPLIAWRVGRMSLVAVPANLVAGAAVAPAMWLGMIAAAVGQVSPVLASPFAWLASVPAAEVLATARMFASPSWASVDWRPAGSLAMLATASVVVCGVGRIPGRGRA